MGDEESELGFHEFERVRNRPDRVRGRRGLEPLNGHLELAIAGVEGGADEERDHGGHGQQQEEEKEEEPSLLEPTAGRPARISRRLLRHFLGLVASLLFAGCC